MSNAETIEELKTKNEELQSSNEKLRAKNFELKRISQDLVNMFDSLQFATVILDKQLRVKRYTPQMKQIFNIQATDIDHVITTLECYLDIPNLRRELLTVIKEGERYQQELEYEGHFFHMSISANKDENGDVYGAILSFEDKTALHQKELELIESETIIKARKERIKKILNGTDNIIFLQGKACEIIHINQQFFNLFPEYKDIEEFKQEHTSIFELFDNEDDEYVSAGYFKEAFPTQLDEKMQRRAKITRNGHTRYFRVTVSPVSLEIGNEEFVVTLSDITELEQEMEKNIKQERILQQQAKMASMGEMIGNIAHQWRQPLNSLATLNTLHMMEFRENNSLSIEQMQEHQEQANLFIQKMSSTIDDFRNFFLPANKQRIHFNLNEAVKRTLGFVQDAYHLHRIQLAIDIDQHTSIKSYQNELEQVLLNLLNNAKDAHLSNKTPEPMVSIRLCQESEGVCLSVQDNAGGIDPKIIDKVFEPYFSTKFEDEGTGIGLYMSKMIIEESMGGKLTIENCKEGVLATIQLPKSDEELT
ncbi:MAG TPA: PAS domain-containing protein [Campylobacterales bacterium]|nr:PAS domain-containing protein [Campylobacterales bacterium]